MCSILRCTALPSFPSVLPQPHPHPSHLPCPQVQGNPTEYYRRVGSGSSLGAGVKVGSVRAEAIRDNNSGRWSAFFTYGERF